MIKNAIIRHGIPFFPNVKKVLQSYCSNKSIPIVVVDHLRTWKFIKQKGNQMHYYLFMLWLTILL